MGLIERLLGFRLQGVHCSLHCGHSLQIEGVSGRSVFDELKHQTAAVEKLVGRVVVLDAVLVSGDESEAANFASLHVGDHHTWAELTATSARGGQDRKGIGLQNIRHTWGHVETSRTQELEPHHLLRPSRPAVLHQIESRVLRKLSEQVNLELVVGCTVKVQIHDFFAAEAA